MAQRRPEYAPAAKRMEDAVFADPALSAYLQRNGFDQGHQRAWEYHRTHGIVEGAEHRFSLSSMHCNQQLDPHAAERQKLNYVEFLNTPIGKLRRRNATFPLNSAAQHQKVLERALTLAERAGDNCYMTLNKQDGENRNFEKPGKDNARSQFHLNSGAWASFEVDRKDEDDRKGVVVAHLEALEARGLVPDIITVTGDVPSWRIQCHFALDAVQNDQAALRSLSKFLCGYHGMDEEGNHLAIGDLAATGAMNLFRLFGSMIFATDEKMKDGYAEYNVALTFTKPLTPSSFDEMVTAAEKLFPEGITPSDIRAGGATTIGDGESETFDAPADPGKPRANYDIVEDFVQSQIKVVENAEVGSRFMTFRAAIAAAACAGPDGYNTHTTQELYDRFMAAFPGDKATRDALHSRNRETTKRGLAEYGDLRSDVIDERSGLFAFEAVAKAAAPIDPVTLAKLQTSVEMLDKAKGAELPVRRRQVLAFASFLGRELTKGNLDPTWAAFIAYRSAIALRVSHKDISLENFISSDLGSQILRAVGVKVKA